MKTDGDLTAALRRNHLFADLGDEQLQLVLETAQLCPLRAGEALFTRGQPAQRFFLLRSGLMKLSRLSPQGEEKIIEIVTPGQMFAEAIMFMEKKGGYPVNATAIEESLAVSFVNETFISILRDSNATCFRLMASMSRRLHQHVSEIDRLTLHTASDRLLNYLVQQARQQNGTMQLQLRVAKNVLAAQLSIKPETLSRIFTRLGNEGLISVDGAQITIHDIETLRRQIQL